MKTYKILAPCASLTPNVDGITIYYPPETGIEPGILKRDVLFCMVSGLNPHDQRPATLHCFTSDQCDRPLFPDDLDLSEMDRGIVRIQTACIPYIFPELFKEEKLAA